MQQEAYAIVGHCAEGAWEVMPGRDLQGHEVTPDPVWRVS